MAFNFPSPATEGQTFTPPVAGAPEYIYRTPVWELVAATSANGLLTISDGPPASPVPGQQWWESDTGLTYVWYADGSSNQWIQTNGAGVTDAPRDGSQYVRQDGEWVLVDIPEGGGTGTVTIINSGSFF